MKKINTSKREGFYIDRITKLIITVSFLVMVNACAPTPLTKLEDRVFEERQSYTVYIPEIAQLELPNNVTVEIEPVEPTYLNKITYLAASQSGDTDRLSFREIRNLKSSDEVNDIDKKKIKQLVIVSDLLNEEYGRKFDDELIEEILITHSSQLNIGFTQSTTVNIRNGINYPKNYNPYYVNGRFLSTLKLSFVNNGSEVQRFRNEEFSVVFQGNNFSPHDHEYFDRRLQNSRQLDNVFNFNMPKELTVGPSQTITRYIGVQPLPVAVDDFSVQYVSGDDFVSTTFTVNRFNETKEYALKGFRIDDRRSLPKNVGQRDRYYILINDHQVKSIDEKQFYILENRVMGENYICGIYHFSQTKVYSTTMFPHPGPINTEPIIKCISIDLSENTEQIINFSLD